MQRDGRCVANPPFPVAQGKLGCKPGRKPFWVLHRRVLTRIRPARTVFS